MGVKLSFPHEGKKHRLRVFKNRVLGRDWGGVTVEWAMRSCAISRSPITVFCSSLSRITGWRGDVWGRKFFVGKPVGKRPHGRP